MVLLEGHLKGGLYVFDSNQIGLKELPAMSSSNKSSPLNSTYIFPSIFPYANVVTKVDNYVSSHDSLLKDFNESVQKSVSNKPSQFDLWHNRLGHPSENIIKVALSKCNLSTVNKSPFSIC